MFSASLRRHSTLNYFPRRQPRGRKHHYLCKNLLLWGHICVFFLSFPSAFSWYSISYYLVFFFQDVNLLLLFHFPFQISFFFLFLSILMSVSIIDIYLLLYFLYLSFISITDIYLFFHLYFQPSHLLPLRISIYLLFLQSFPLPLISSFTPITNVLWGYETLTRVGKKYYEILSKQRSMLEKSFAVIFSVYKDE